MTEPVEFKSHSYMYCDIVLFLFLIGVAQFDITFDIFVDAIR